MSNNDTVDVEGPPEGGISPSPSEGTATLEGAAPGTVPLGSPTATLEGGPPTSAEGMPQQAGGRGGFMEIPGWLGGPQGPLGQIMGGMAGMGGQAQSPGEQVHQRHGGFLTGLAGVLIEGLASGLAPNAQMAYQIPMQINQQRMQQQQLQMQQMKMQQEMREAPLREQMQWAQTLVAMQSLRHAMANDTTENQLGMSDTEMKIVEDARKNNAMTVLGQGSLQDIMGPNGALETERRKDPKNAMNIMPTNMQTDSQGHVLKAAVVRIEPGAMTGDEDKEYTVPYKDEAGNVHTIHATLPANMPYKEGMSYVMNQLSEGLTNVTGLGKGAGTPQLLYQNGMPAGSLNPRTGQVKLFSDMPQGLTTGGQQKMLQASQKDIANLQTGLQSLQRYQTSFLANRDQLSAEDLKALEVLTTREDHIADNFLGMSEGAIADLISKFPLSGYSQGLMKGAMEREQFDALSDPAKKMFADYSHAVVSNMLIMRARFQGNPRQAEIVRAEMRNIPLPFVDKQSATDLFSDTFQDHGSYLKSVYGQQMQDVPQGPGITPGAGIGGGTPQGRPVRQGGRIIGYTTDGKTMTPVQ